MILTKYAIENMGFTEYPETDELKITFAIVKAYSLRGMVFEKDCEIKQSKVTSFGANCTAVISQSINEASQLLTNHVVADDEETWLSDNKASPPFLLLYFRESKTSTLQGGYRQEKEGNIYTYDTFADEKVEIRNWENDVELRIVTALTVHLSTLKRPVEIVPVSRSIFGTTSEGKILFDLKVTGSATAYVSSPKSTDSMAESLEKAEQLFFDLNKDSIRHFYAALNQKDRFKQFLGYFMFIERLTHRTYKSLSYEGDAKKLFRILDRMENTCSDFFSTVFSESKNLAHRFRWCAMTSWDQLDDQDVSDFVSLKKARDSLAHGENIKEADLPVEKAKMLGLKLLGTEKT